MEINLDKYRHCLDSFKYALENNKDYPKDVVTRFSSSYGIPVIVLYYYLEEIIGKQDFIEEAKKSLTEFYGYTIIKETKGETNE